MNNETNTPETNEVSTQQVNQLSTNTEGNKQTAKFPLIAKTFMGLEQVLARELTELGSQQCRDRTPHGILHR